MLIRYGTDSDGRPVKKAVVYTKGEHGIDRENIDADALWVAARLHGAGFSAYIVGGAVRDLIVGNIPKDFDIVTDATPSRIRRIFRNSRIIGRRFRLVLVSAGSKIFEVSTFRSTAAGSVGNDFGSMDEDVRRRDFTINALYYDPFREQVIDYVGGFRDIKKHALRPVIPLDVIFVEDPVRMIRAIKYSAMTGAHIPFALRHKIKHSAHLLADVSSSRLSEELLKIINGGHMRDIAREALDSGVYQYLQPSACALMRGDKNFEAAYMESLARLDEFNREEGDARLGRKLAFVLFDFVKTLADWQKEVEAETPASELYALAWSECRRFVLPMNPRRTELEFAVRLMLSSLGVQVKGKSFRPRRAGVHRAPAP